MEELTHIELSEFVSYLKKEKYKNLIQDLKLELCTDDKGDYIVLNIIKIKKSQQNKGYGSAVMYDLCKFADDHNVRIWLFPTDIYGSDLKRLFQFYRRHGFVLFKDGGVNGMFYHPQRKKNLKKSVTK